METDLFVRAVSIGHDFFAGGKIISALKSATCSIGPADRIAIVGPSGSGKSTLLHILAGLADQTSGFVGWPALGQKENLRPGKIGFIAQEQSLVSSLNVKENIELPLVFLGMGKKAAGEVAMDILGKLELIQIAEKLPKELSGGQMKRAASARALVTKPKMILADEPTGQLDHATARHFLDVLFKYVQGSDTAIVMTTHDTEVARLMDTIWMMDHGVLEEKVK
jgi:putative ABC transport system ATP-binding protein/lipoprotein-releasing system ATP-binding protein